MQTGTLYGISVGPGDPELITLKGLHLLKSVPVVAFPAGIGGKQGIAQGIVAQWLQPDQVQLALQFPYLQDEAVLNSAWQLAAQQVWSYLERGKDVAFACEGDISFYSTFNYLAATLQQQHPEVRVQTVPGVASPMAAAGALGLPLTIRDQRLVILPALYRVEELEAVLNWADVVVLMKVSSVYPQIWRMLEQRDLLQYSYVVERATTAEQVVYADLRDRSDLKLHSFSLLIVKVNGV